MDDYPFPIQKYLLSLLVESRHPGYLYLSVDGQVIEAGGDLGHYGLPIFKKDQPIREHVCFLHGLLPLNGEVVLIPLLQFDATHFANLHLIPGEVGDWVLLLDVTEEAHQQSYWQQIAYAQNLNSGHSIPSYR